jgi:hypothetical protein
MSLKVKINKKFPDKKSDHTQSQGSRTRQQLMEFIFPRIPLSLYSEANFKELECSQVDAQLL